MRGTTFDKNAIREEERHYETGVVFNSTEEKESVLERFFDLYEVPLSKSVKRVDLYICKCDFERIKETLEFDFKYTNIISIRIRIVDLDDFINQKTLKWKLVISYHADKNNSAKKCYTVFRQQTTFKYLLNKLGDMKVTHVVYKDLETTSNTIEEQFEVGQFVFMKTETMNIISDWFPFITSLEYSKTADVLARKNQPFTVIQYGSTLGKINIFGYSGAEIEIPNKKKKSRIDKIEKLFSGYTECKWTKSEIDSVQKFCQ